VGWWGYHLTRSTSANIRRATILPDGTKTFPTTNTRINPAFGNITLLLADTVSNYNGMQAVLRKTAGGGLMFQASYTYSKALSEADSSANRVTDNTGSGYSTLDKDDPGRDYGRSASDQRQTFVFNAQYQFVALDRLLNGGIAKALLGGWAMNGVWQYGSGLPAVECQPAVQPFAEPELGNPGPAQSGAGGQQQSDSWSNFWVRRHPRRSETAHPEPVV